MRRLSIVSMPRTTSFRSTTRGCTICFRLKARSCRVRAEARCAVSSTSSTSRRSGLSGGSFSSRSWLRPVITVRRLLKSWATPAGEPPDRLHLLGVTELRLERPDSGEIAHDDDDPEVLVLAALEGGRRDLDRHDLPVRPGSVTVTVRPVRHWMAACRMATSSGAWPRTSVDVPAAGGGRGRAAEQRFGGAVQGDHAAIEIEGDDPVDQRVEDVIGVALQVGQLGEAAAELPVGRLEGRPLLEERRALLVELPRHLVEGGRPAARSRPTSSARPAGPAPPARSRPRRPRAAGRAARSAGRPGPTRAPPRPGRGRPEGPAGAAWRRSPPPSGGARARPGPCPSAGRRPGSAPRSRRAPPRPARRAPGQGGVRREDAVERAAGEEGAHDLGPVVVGRDAPVAVEDHRVGDVGLGGDARHVLLELRVVVEDERSGGPGRQVARQRVPAPLDLADDGLALPVLDDDDQRAHDRGDDEERADQELRLEGDEAAPRPARGRPTSTGEARPDGGGSAGSVVTLSSAAGPAGAARRK